MGRGACVRFGVWALVPLQGVDAGCCCQMSLAVERGWWCRCNLLLLSGVYASVIVLHCVGFQKHSVYNSVYLDPLPKIPGWPSNAQANQDVFRRLSVSMEWCSTSGSGTVGYVIWCSETPPNNLGAPTRPLPGRGSRGGITTTTSRSTESLLQPLVAQNPAQLPPSTTTTTSRSAETLLQPLVAQNPS